MKIKKVFSRGRVSTMILIGLALGVSGIFKIAAFAREAFIAARFGLSAITDAYFALQQFPITLATYMYGAFALAFVPAYLQARKRNNETAAWIPGLLIWCFLAGTALTVLMSLGSSWLVGTLHIQNSIDVHTTVVLLSLCFAPITLIGIWASICTARGHNLWAMSMTGFPYLLMTVTLFGLYAIGRLNNLSLPISMTLGFIIVGAYSLVRIVLSQPMPRFNVSSLAIWRDLHFRAFLRQLGASSVENCGFAANQFLLIYFLSQTGTGVISANTCAMRIATLGYTLLGMPLGQLVQGRLCTVSEDERPAAFRRWFVIVVVLMVAVALPLFLFRYPIIRLVYMHGKFQDTALQTVASLMPAWIAYMVVMSINAVLARYLFILTRGSVYVRQQIFAYVAANLLRIVVTGRFDAYWIIWCSVGAEGCSLLLNLRTCLTASREQIAKTAAELEALTEVA